MHKDNKLLTNLTVCAESKNLMQKDVFYITLILKKCHITTFFYINNINKYLVKSAEVIRVVKFVVVRKKDMARTRSWPQTATDHTDHAKNYKVCHTQKWPQVHYRFNMALTWFSSDHCGSLHCHASLIYLQNQTDWMIYFDASFS